MVYSNSLDKNELTIYNNEMKLKIHKKRTTNNEQLESITKHEIIADAAFNVTPVVFVMSLQAL